MAVLDEDSADILGTVSGILIDPDTGTVKGFFVRVRGFLQSQELFLSVLDILHWGTRITVRDRDVLTGLEDHVRLQGIIESNRPVLGQRIRTEGGRLIGRCMDVQFNTEHFRLEWLFPSRFFRWGLPIPVSQIIEIRTEAIIVREQSPTAEEKAEMTLLPQLPEAA